MENENVLEYLRTQLKDAQAHYDAAELTAKMWRERVDAFQTALNALEPLTPPSPKTEDMAPRIHVVPVSQPTAVYGSFSEALKALLDKEGLSAGKLASRLKLASCTVYSWSRGLTTPDSKTWDSLSKELAEITGNTMKAYDFKAALEKSEQIKKAERRAHAYNQKS